MAARGLETNSRPQKSFPEAEAFLKIDT